MSHISDGTGKVVSGLVGAIGILAAWAIVGLISLCAAAGTALYFFIVWALPHVVELCDILTIWLVDKL